jgi:hypothetical protein
MDFDEVIFDEVMFDEVIFDEVSHPHFCVSAFPSFFRLLYEIVEM